MRTMERDDATRGRHGRRCGCGGGSGCRGGNGHGGRQHHEDATTTLRTTLEERQRDLEQELADVTEQLRDLRTK